MERRKPCTIFGTLGTDARNCSEDVRIVICTSLIECRKSRLKQYLPYKEWFPLSFTENRQGKYKVQSGEMIRSLHDFGFFLAEADEWRPRGLGTLNSTKT
jgi:hypothetical protein